MTTILKNMLQTLYSFHHMKLATIRLLFRYLRQVHSYRFSCMSPKLALVLTFVNKTVIFCNIQQILQTVQVLRFNCVVLSN